MKLKLLPFALTLALAGYAATTGEDKKPDTPTAKPDGDKPRAVAVSKVELKLMVIFGGDYTFTADGVNVTKEVLKWSDMMDSSKPRVPQKSEVMPDKKAWDDFWETVNQLKLETWRQKYSTDDLTVKTENGGFSEVRVMDGMSWSMSFTRQQQSNSSEGHNAYPTVGDPKKTTLDEAVVSKLASAFDKLLASVAVK